MKRVYNVECSSAGIQELKKGLDEYDKWLERKSKELCERLAMMGAMRASANFGVIKYDGPEDHSISVEQRDGGYVVIASGSTVLFVEFGSGLIGYGHPEAHGLGPGTYPGKGHWDDPDGWYYAHGKKSRGNPPNMPMYNTVKDLERELERLVREVFEL